MDVIWSIGRTLGGILGILLPILLVVYLFPGSPLRRAVEIWIDARVAVRFNKELEQFRHQLQIDAEAVRADHQRRLHDFGLYSVRRHDVYRELFRLLLEADGHVGQLSGVRFTYQYDDLSREDITIFMEKAEFIGSAKELVLTHWDTDRARAVSEIKATMRRIEIADAEAAVNKAWNYFLVNSLYLSDAHSDAVNGILKNLRSNLLHTNVPVNDSAKEQKRLKAESSELIERLRRSLREELEASAAMPPARPPAAK